MHNTISMQKWNKNYINKLFFLLVLSIFVPIIKIWIKSSAVLSLDVTWCYLMLRHGKPYLQALVRHVAGDVKCVCLKTCIFHPLLYRFHFLFSIFKLRNIVTVCPNYCMSIVSFYEEILSYNLCQCILRSVMKTGLPMSVLGSFTVIKHKTCQQYDCNNPEIYIDWSSQRQIRSIQSHNWCLDIVHTEMHDCVSFDSFSFGWVWIKLTSRVAEL